MGITAAHDCGLILGFFLAIANVVWQAMSFCRFFGFAYRYRQLSDPHTGQGATSRYRCHGAAPTSNPYRRKPGMKTAQAVISITNAITPAATEASNGEARSWPTDRLLSTARTMTLPITHTGIGSTSKCQLIADPEHTFLAPIFGSGKRLPRPVSKARWISNDGAACISVEDFEDRMLRTPTFQQPRDIGGNPRCGIGRDRPARVSATEAERTSMNGGTGRGRQKAD